jgi:superfamily II DNA/RNA helicase
MIFKLFKAQFSSNAFKSAKPTRTVKSISISENAAGNKLESLHTPLKIDDLRAIYQKQSKSSVISFHSFEEVPHLSLDLLAQMNRNGISKPTEVQMNMLGQFASDAETDLLIKSRPGSGKSLGYVILLLADFFKKKARRINSDGKAFKYLIIVPSDLLARQIDSWIRELSRNSAKTSLLCETFSSNDSSDCDFLIATPESFRIKLAQGELNVKGIECVVLDEADALVKPLKRFASPKQKEMRLKHPVTCMLLLSEILKAIASNKLLTRPRMIVASATLNKLTRDQLISTGIVKNPVFLDESNSHRETEAKVKHFHVLLKNPEDPLELVNTLATIVKQNLKTSKRGAIFLPAAQSKLGLCELLRSSPAFSDISIGLLNQYQRNDSQTNSQLLIASDVDCRGIDIPELGFVVILDLPGSIESFIHMAGRVGRTSQASGSVYTVIGTIQDFNKFSSLLRNIPLTTIPFMENMHE